MKKVSIIIPNFNRAGLLKETLNSVLAQTYPHWEALVVDDGSTDNSHSVVQAYAAGDSRIKLIPRDRLPKGAPTCRNIGIERASGDFIIFLDSDDLIAPHCLKQRIETAEKHPAFDLYVFPASGFYKAIGDVPDHESGYGIKPGQTLYDFAAGNSFFIISQCFWKRPYLVNQKLYFHEDLKSGQDFYFHFQAFFHNTRAYFSTESIDHYIRWSSEGRISNDAKNKKHDESRLQILKGIIEKEPAREISEYAFYRMSSTSHSLEYILKMNQFMLKSRRLSFLTTEKIFFKSTAKFLEKRAKKMLRNLLIKGRDYIKKWGLFEIIFQAELHSVAVR